MVNDEVGVNCLYVVSWSGGSSHGILKFIYDSLDTNQVEALRQSYLLTLVY